ncbi:hypothetical protein IV203_011804 [Nitzschia inconspicua]|uniref:F-box domain-containing protein n=1 Tax=Nitzschia inconspicua TaxID=303405 RepID=A0A9K3KTD5_9STRA|nr:hypothetical protein IV203_011804 [Nitzschia inconspicua]
MACSHIDTLGRDSNVENSFESSTIELTSRDDPVEIESFKDSENSDQVTIFLPMELFPDVLSFCSLSTLAKIRCVSKTFRDDFVAKESFFRYHNVDDRTKAIRSQAGHQIIGTWWGSNLESTIEKAIQVATPLFYEVIPFLDGEVPEVEHDHIGGTTVLLAKDYDETNVRELLMKDSVVLGENWGIEARYNLVPLVEAFKEVNVGIHSGGQGALNVLMTASPRKFVHISECEVSIQQYPHTRRRIVAYQVIAFESIGGGISAIIAEADLYNIHY